MEHRSGESGRHRRWRKWQWLVVPLVVVFAVEFGAREIISRYDGWYSVNTKRPPDMIVIGSSRVEAGVDARQLSEQLSKRAGTEVRVSNQGRGGSTITVQYLALRNLLETLPEEDRAVLVGLEVPGGVPADLVRKTWSDPWADPAYLNLLPRFLRGTDLDDYWSADQAVGDELSVTLQWLFSFSDLSLYREQFRDRLFSQGSRLTTDALRRLSPAAVDPSLAGKAGGGVFSDAVRLQDARDFAEELAEREISGGQVVQDWNEYVIADLVELVRSYGGDVVFFDMPVASGFARQFDSDVHRRNLESFGDFADQHDLVVLDLGLELDDSAFPDLWHLGADGARVTTERIGTTLPLGLLESAASEG
jgi:hypothetical protein